MGKPRFITLSATADMHLYPHNTLTSFTNTIPIALQAYSQKQLYVRIRNILIDRRMTTADNEQPQILHVHLNEMYSQDQRELFNATLGCLQYPADTIYGEYTFHEFKLSPFLPLSAYPLSQLHIYITDENRRALSLDRQSSSPTLVTLEISEMPEHSQFTIACLSHASREAYPDNQPTKFSVELPHALHLPDWEVAFLNMTLPIGAKYVRELWFSVTLVGIRNIPTRKFVFNVFDYESTSAFLDAVQDQLLSDPVIGRLLYVHTSVENETDITHFTVLDQDGILDTDSSDEEDARQTKGVRLEFSEWFSKALGQNEKPDTVTLHSGQSMLFTGTPNIDFAKPGPTGLLFTNCIDHNIVGGQLSQLLQIIPLEHFHSSRIYEPTTPIFHSVTTVPFNSIHLHIQEAVNVGDTPDIQLNQPSSGVMILLLFRKKRQNKQ